MSNSDVFKSIRKRVEKAANKVASKTNMTRIAKSIANIIRVRTRLGFGADNRRKYSLREKPFSKKYLDYRKKNKRKGRGLSSKTSPSKNNLTFTGQMLDDIRGRSFRTGTAIIDFKSQRSSEIASYHETQGAGKSKVKRPFFSLTRQERKQLQNKIRKQIQDQLRSTLTK